MKNRIFTLFAMVFVLNGCSQEPAMVETKTSTSYAKASAIKSVKVERSQTVSNIARAYGISTSELAALNGMTPDQVVQKGQSIKIPGHKVRTHDTTEITSENLMPPDSYENIKSNTSPTLEEKIAKAKSINESFTSERNKEIDKALDSLDNPAYVKPAAKQQQNTLPKTSEYAIPSPIGKPNFEWPIYGHILQHFSPDIEGIYIAAEKGAPIRAASDGEVVYVGNDEQQYGNLLIIKHKDGIFTAYAHNDTVLVKQGASVKKGAIVARAGSSGSVDKPQSYFSVRVNDTTVDPEKVFNIDIME